MNYSDDNSTIFVTPGDCVRFYITEEVFNYFKKVFAWEQDRYDAYQLTIEHDLNPIYINNYTGQLWGELYNKLGIDFARFSYDESMRYKWFDLLITDKKENGVLDFAPLNNMFSKNTIHYLNGLQVALKDINKKYFKLGAAPGISTKKELTKEEHNAEIQRKIKELQQQLVD